MPDTPDRPTGPKVLDRAPGERYRGTTPPAAGRPAPSAEPEPGGSPRRALAAAAGVAVAVAVGRAFVGQVDLGPGALAIGAFGGWVTALALVWGAGGRRLRRQPLLAALFGGGAILGGLVLESLLARAGGGVLGPLAYIDARYGLLAWLEVAIASAVAAVRAR